MGKAVLKEDVPVIEKELLLTNTQQTCDQWIQCLGRETDTENSENISNKKKMNMVIQKSDIATSLMHMTRRARTDLQRIRTIYHSILLTKQTIKDLKYKCKNLMAHFHDSLWYFLKLQCFATA